MSSATQYLDLEDALRLCDVLGIGPVRDLGLLGSALARPGTTLLGADAHPDLAAKSAALLESVVQNQALLDGNKRLGWTCLVVVLDLNGIWLEVDDDEAFDLVMDVASGRAGHDVVRGVIAGWIASCAAADRSAHRP